MDEAGLIRSQMGTHNRSEMVAVCGTPNAIPPLTITLIHNDPRIKRYKTMHLKMSWK
jgi:hypothetical protein